MASRQSVHYAQGQISLCRFLLCYFHSLRVTVQEAEYESNKFSRDHVDRTAHFTRWDLRPAVLIFLSLNKHAEAVHTILALFVLLEERESWYVTTRTS